MKQGKKIRPTLICYIVNGNKVICDKRDEGDSLNIINRALLTNMAG